MIRLAFAASFLALSAACGGAVDQGSTTDTRDSRATARESDTAPPSTSGTGTFGNAGSTGTGAAAPSPPRTATPRAPGKVLDVSGACAVKRPSTGTVGTGGAPRCQVSSKKVDAKTGFVSYQRITNGDAGSADLQNRALLLRCDDADRVLFQAVIRCFEGDGEYTIAPGDLVLGEELSDRSCEVLVSLSETGVGGFLTCPNAPEAGNIFSTSGPPVGLGGFALPRSF